MRAEADAPRIVALLRALGSAAGGESKAYLTGGATAVLIGWRSSTIDVDLKLEPERDELLRRIAELKEELHINVELPSPVDSIPELPGWRERSPAVLRAGTLEVHHFDPYSQALSKVERGFAQDLEDVTALVARELVDPGRALELFAEMEPQLFRYPALDPAAFRVKVERAFA